jgi:sugar lactone lactonase YvrE
MFYIDTPLRSVDVLNLDMGSGTVSDRRPVVAIPPDEGFPDGMTIDANGALTMCFSNFVPPFSEFHAD